MMNYEKLQTLIAEIDVLIEQGVTTRSPDFQAWKLSVERFLAKCFGKSSIEFEQFHKIAFTDWFDESAHACVVGLETTRKVLSNYLSELKEVPALAELNAQKAIGDFQKVFVVHGHDTGLKEAVAGLLRRQGINAVILQEQVNASATIIEKFEAHSDVDAAICLFTADDIGASVNSKEYAKRARQNVVFEAGFFIGKLGRERVIIIKDSDIEIPSDLDGVVSAKSSNWEIRVLQELESIGYSIDYNIAFSKNR